MSFNAKTFLNEFFADQFPEPSPLGPRIGFNQHEPPFTMTQLRKMAKQGLIVLDERDQSYRLTIKAALHKDRKPR